MQRIGVSVAIPDPWGQQLQDYRVGLGDQAAQGIPTHITLLPPLEVPGDQLETISAHLSECALQSGPMRIHLRGTGTFRPVSPVIFINVVAGISQLEMLAKQIRQGPLAVETKFPYHPHVTVAQELDDDLLDQAFDELAGFDMTFMASEVWLYLHSDEAGWQPMRSFPLG
jgi:2'-5' RNA ligase